MESERVKVDPDVAMHDTVKISVVIPFCSFEADLIDRVVASCAPVSDDIVLVVLSHRFDGSDDAAAWDIATRVARTHAGVRPVRLQWRPMPGAPTRFWINEMRMHGFGVARHDWILFLDADEVIREPTSFARWFESARQDTSVAAYKLSNYWYFLSEKRRARELEDSAVLIRRDWVHMAAFRQYHLERELLVDALPAGRLRRATRDLGGAPLIDHFSWVRPKDVLLAKAAAWTHRGEKPWEELIETAFQENLLTTRDFVHGRTEWEILE